MHSIMQPFGCMSSVIYLKLVFMVKEVGYRLAFFA
jgi:hypothetical protein